MKKDKVSRPLIAASLPNKGNRMIYEYRIHHIDWKEKANVTGNSSPFSFINLQSKVYPSHHFFPSHSHPMFEFYAVLKGRVVMSLGTKKIVPVELRPGTAVIIAPHNFHSATSERPASAVNVHFALRGSAARNKALAHISGRHIRLSRDARTKLAALSKLPAGKASNNLARILKSEFNSILEAITGGNRKKKQP